MIQIIANISMERNRKTSAPPPTSCVDLATPTPPSEILAPSSSGKSGKVFQKKISVPVCPPCLKMAPPTVPVHVDASELIQRLKMAYTIPETPSLPPSTVSMQPSPALSAMSLTRCFLFFPPETCSCLHCRCSGSSSTFPKC